MGTDRIRNAISENCKDDKLMENMLLDLLKFNLTGRQWYKEEYGNIITKYAQQKEGSNEN